MKTEMSQSQRLPLPVPRFAAAAHCRCFPHMFFAFPPACEDQKCQLTMAGAAPVILTKVEMSSSWLPSMMDDQNVHFVRGRMMLAFRLYEADAGAVCNKASLSGRTPGTRASKLKLHVICCQMVRASSFTFLCIHDTRIILG